MNMRTIMVNLRLGGDEQIYVFTNRLEALTAIARFKLVYGECMRASIIEH